MQLRHECRNVALTNKVFVIYNKTYLFWFYLLNSKFVNLKSFDQKFLRIEINLWILYHFKIVETSLSI